MGMGATRRFIPPALSSLLIDFDVGEITICLHIDTVFAGAVLTPVAGTVDGFLATHFEEAIAAIRYVMIFGGIIVGSFGFGFGRGFIETFDEL